MKKLKKTNMEAIDRIVDKIEGFNEKHEKVLRQHLKNVEGLKLLLRKLKKKKP